MRSIFINSSRQVRSGWKIAATIIVYIILQIMLTMIISIAVAAIISASSRGLLDNSQIVSYITEVMRDNAAARMVTQFVDFISLMLVTYLMLRLFDRRGFKDIGLTSVHKGYKDFAYGLALGAVSMTFIFVVLLLTGNIILGDALRFDFSQSLLWGLLLFIIVGIKEEVLIRGYCITVLNQMKKPWLSIIISSVIFSLLHFFNPNVRPLGLLNIVFVGILFGYMFIKSGNLWMPIGYHITWNYFQGSIFGLAVSGGTQKGIFDIQSVKDNILTGGSFGPEAGILATAAIALGLILVWRLQRKV